MHKVFILCGGRGKRLQSLTTDIPKPLVKLQGKPILQHIIEFYVQRNFSQFVLCTGYRSEAIESFVSKQRLNAEIEISNQGEDASMLERLHAVRHLMGEKAIVTYGDTYINLDVQGVLDLHDSQKAEITITVTDIRNPFGVVKLHKHKVVLFEEKPLFSYYIGHMIMNRCVLDRLEPKFLKEPDGSGLISLFQHTIAKGTLGAFVHKGLQLTFNTLQEHKKADEEMMKFFTEQES